MLIALPVGLAPSHSVDENVFLASSFAPPTTHQLLGAAFEREDLILGSGGYEAYRATRAATVEPGQDGAYIVVNPNDTGTVIGTDFVGQYKLFLYRHGDAWILSNSLLEAARFAADRGLPITVDENHLASFFIRGSFGNQLTSLHTSVREIMLVPSMMEVVIGRSSSGDRLELRMTQAGDRARHAHGTYDEALRDYLRLWVGRMATLLRSNIDVQSELTGGQDSRAVLGLLLAASRLIGPEAIRSVRFRSDPGAEIDYAVASRIADRFGLSFMDPAHRSIPRLRLSTAAGYERWKALCLGVYAPIYFPKQRSTPTAVTLGGTGGEGHRQFYTGRSLAGFLAKRRRYIPSAAEFMTLRQDILDDTAFLNQASDPSVNEMVVHYRNFRERCHGGRTPQYTHLLSPLSGADLRRASSLCGPERFARRQISADILLNLDRDLASMPFDKPEKAFGARHLADSVDAGDAIREARTSGQVFAGSAPTGEAGQFSTEAALVMLRDDFLANLEVVDGTGYFPSAYVARAKAVVEAAVPNGRLPHPVDACSVSHVILAGELSRLSGQPLSSTSTPGLLRRAIARLHPGP